MDRKAKKDARSEKCNAALLETLHTLLPGVEIGVDVSTSTSTSASTANTNMTTEFLRAWKRRKKAWKAKKDGVWTGERVRIGKEEGVGGKYWNV